MTHKIVEYQTNIYGVKVIKAEYTLIDNKKEGLYKVFHKNEKLKSVLNYINDKKTGVYKEYDERENLLYECSYNDDKKNGLYKVYYRNSLSSASSSISLSGVKSEVNYIDDKKEGLYKEYNEDGSISKIYTYINDKKEGLYKEYYPKVKIGVMNTETDLEDNLSVKLEVNYVNDKRTGLYITYHPNKSIAIICNYVNDKIEGTYREYFSKKIPKGSKIKIEDYKETGILKEDSFYINGYKEGICKYYSENPTLDPVTKEIVPKIRMFKRGEPMKI
jgi:antitoxin component YwqK of YwqJK toxin-antitoxin module